MAYFEPNGILKLCAGIPITDSQQIVFQNIDNQVAYYNNRVRHTLNDMSYMPHDGTVLVELSPEQVKQCNYMTWANPSQESRVWYARIVDYRWVNSAATTEITYKIDWFQSFMFAHTVNFAEMDREQLSSTDWEKAMTNPFDPSIIELRTPEPIAVGPEFEPQYELAAIGSPARAGMSFYPSEGGTIKQFMLMVINMGWVTDADKTAWEAALRASFSVDLGDGISTPTVLSSFPTTLGYIYWNVTGGKWKSVIDYLTINGLVSEIIGIYNVHEDVINSIKSGGGAWTGNNIDMEVFKSYRHPKLCRSPFQYLRVTSPSGTSKEYQYEKFAGLAGGSSNFSMKFLNNVLGNPVSYVAPVGYGRKIEDPMRSIDEHQRIEYSDMPQVGFNTDAYLTFLSSQYNSAIAANSAAQQLRNNYRGTDNYYYAQLQSTGAAEGFGFDLNAVKRSLTTIGQMTATPYEGASFRDLYYAQNAAQLNEIKANQAENQQTMDVLAEANRRSINAADSSALSYAKGAYVADNYTPGGSAGYIPYQIGSGTPTWTFTRVSLDETYIKQVEDYLLRYGCRSGRFGLPYVYQYMHGGTAPHWVEIGGLNVSFCKCSAVDVVCNMTPAAAAIASIYKGGCLFIKGD